MKKLLTAILLAVFTMQVNAQDNANKETLTMLAAAKMAGSCGMFFSMMDFQKATKLTGGDEFLSRFLLMETSRLNIPMQNYFDLCAESIKKYDTVWSLIDNPAQ